MKTLFVARNRLAFIVASFLSSASFASSFEYQPLRKAEQQLLEYFVDRCNRPLPPLTSFPVGFEHPMDIISCEVAEYYGKSTKKNFFQLSRGIYQHARDNSFNIGERNRSVGLEKFYTDGNMSLDALAKAASLGDPNLIKLVLTHPDRKRLTTSQRDSLSNYYPEVFLNLALDDLTQYEISEIVELIAPIVKHADRYSPEILETVHPWVLNALLKKQDRALIYKELLMLNRESQAILLAYLSLLRPEAIANTEFFSIRRLLQSELWPSKALVRGWSFNNLSTLDIDASVQPLSYYLIALNNVDKFFEYDPPYVSFIGLVDYLKTVRAEYPSLVEFDFLFPKAVDFLKQIPTEYSDRSRAILDFSAIPVSAWERTLLEGVSASLILSNFVSDPNQNRFSEEQKNWYRQTFAEYRAKAPPFKQFFLEANYLSAAHGFDDQGNAVIPPAQIFEDFVNDKQQMLPSECPLTEKFECLKYWASFPLYDVLGATVNSTREFICEYPTQLKFIGEQAARNFVFPERFLASCDADALVKAMGKSHNISTLKENFWHTLIYPRPIGGTQWGMSRVFLDGEMGTFGSHLLNRSNKNNFPVTRNAFLMAYGADRQGWSYLLDLGQTSFPKPFNQQPANGLRLTAHFENYGALQSAVGNVDKAFSAFNYAVVQNAELTKEKPTVDFANLFFLGRSLGLPSDYLLQFMGENRAGNKPYGNRKIDVLWEEFYKAYLSDTESIPLIPAIQSLRGASDFDAFKKAARIQGQIWRGGSQAKNALCQIDSIREYILDNGDKFPVRRPLDTSLYGGVFAYYEVGNLDSICRVADMTAMAEKNDQKMLDAAYQKFLSDSINPFIVQGLNVSDIRYLDSFVSFAVASMLNDREFGAVLSLSALKNIYLKLASGYVTRNSDALRYSQSKIERALVAIGVQVVRIAERNSNVGQVPIADDWMALTLSAKHPLLNDKVKRRFLDSTSFHSKEKVDEHFDAIRNLRLSISESESIFDYINATSQFSENSLDELPFYPFISAQSFGNYNLNLPPTENIDIQFLSISASESAVSILGIGNDRRYFGDVINLSASTQPLIDQILKESEITPQTELALCDAFQPIHNYLSGHISLGSAPLFVSPSVNLFPIPIELVIGSGCTKNHLPIVLVNDFTGAINAAKNIDSKKFPKQLYAVANPQLDDQSGFDSLISDIRGHRLNQSRSIDTAILDNLAPLPDAEVEVHTISSLFETSEISTGREASISNALTAAEHGNDIALVLATHGLPVSANIENETPALLSIEKEKLGLVSSMDVYQYSLSNATVMLSACDTAAGFVENPTLMFTGFVKSFADSGADVIVASLWPVKSYASRIFTEEYFKVWHKSGRPFDALSAAKARIDGTDRYPFVLIAP